MVSKLLKRTPTKAIKRTPPPKPLKDLRRSRPSRGGTTPSMKSPAIVDAAAAASVVISTIHKSVSICQRRLIKLFTKFARLSTPVCRRQRRRGGYRLLGKASATSVDAPLAFSLPPEPLPPPTHPDRRTVFLDLDETLIHSMPDPPPEKFDFVIRPIIDGQRVNFYVLKRPGVEEFLEEIGKSFEIVVFTAGLKEYASLVLDWLDSKKVISHRLYRDSCQQTEGKFVKDLSELGRELSHVVIVDDNPNAYSLQPENALPVVPFVDDPADGELRRVMQFFEFSAGFDDLRDALAQFKALAAPPLQAEAAVGA